MRCSEFFAIAIFKSKQTLLGVEIQLFVLFSENKIKNQHQSLGKKVNVEKREENHS